MTDIDVYAETRATMDADSAASYLSITVSTLKRLVREGKGPKYARISRVLSFRKSDLDTWLAAQFDKTPKKAAKRASKADPLAA